MRRLLLVIPIMVLGCGFLSSLTLNPPQTPEEVFETAEVAYSSALESAVGYARACGSVPVPTDQCDTFIVKLRDTNKRAQDMLFIGGLLSAGVTDCDETIEPGCTGRKLRLLAMQLNDLVFLISEKE